MTAKNKRDLALAVKFVVLGVFLVLVMFPFVWMLLTSLKGSQGEIYAFPVKYLPNPVSFVNYVGIFNARLAISSFMWTMNDRLFNVA